jgi:carboxyl-terminal processing protease
MRAPTGIWISQGYGWLLDVGSDGYTLHHLTRASAQAAERGTLADFTAAYDIDELTATRMTLRQAHDLTRYVFERAGAFPQLARIDAPQRDPLVNFDTLWDLFDEHYAFFALHGVDWAALRARHRPGTGAGTTDDQLLEIFAQMLAPLDDGHVSLSAGTRSIQCLRAMPLRRSMQAAFGVPLPRVSPRATVDAISARVEDLLLAPFAATRTPLRRAGNDILAWCRLTPGAGYVSLLRLFGFAASAAARRADDLPHARADVATFLRDDIAALEPALDACFTDLAGSRSLVLDLRVNGGGFDRCGVAIAQRFADRERLAFSKQARRGDALTATQEILLRPASGPRFGGPVHVLTSPLCVSAGEVLLLCLRALPQVRLLGEPTAGMLSDNLNKPLPNGWEVSLSNEIYRAHDGAVFEGRGVAPHVALATTDASRLVESLRESLVQAVALLP